MAVRSEPRDSLEIHLLGLVDFDAALALQERLIYDISGRADRMGSLLVCEHPPIVTLGASASATHVLTPPAELAPLGIDIRWIGRGGGACCHAPGQLAVYPILPLDRLGITLAEFRTRLEEACVATCHEVHVPARRREEHPGVWGRGGHLALTGAAYRNGVTHHGLFLNVSPDPSFLRVVETNAAGEPATSMQAQLIRRVPMARVREALTRHLAAGFGYELTHLYTGHPLLQRTTRKVPFHV